LAASIGRYAERAIVLSQLEAGTLEDLRCKRIGAPLLFGRLWQDTGCRAAIDALLAYRQFEYPVEQADFISVLHRIMVSGSGRACEKWMTDYDIGGLYELACTTASTVPCLWRESLSVAGRCAGRRP
jgi:hypothetical protein